MYKLRKMYSSTILEKTFLLKSLLTCGTLPSLVVEAPSINCFKMRLGKFWSNQDVLYNSGKHCLVEN